MHCINGFLACHLVCSELEYQGNLVMLCVHAMVFQSSDRQHSHSSLSAVPLSIDQNSTSRDESEKALSAIENKKQIERFYIHPSIV